MTQQIGPNTLGTMKAMLTRYHKENEDTDLLSDAINDAIESLWRSILLVNLSQFLGGPITTLQIAAGSERATIISLADPTVAPVPAAVVQGALPQRNLILAYTYVTESGSETNLSPGAAITIPANSILQVPAPPEVPDAMGWNIYVEAETGIPGAGDARDGRQNAVPLSFSQVWQEPADKGISNAPDLPSAPSVNNTADNIFYIRLLQVQNQDSTWTTWSAGDLDGLLMQRASRSIASTSSYQGYAYDVVNGSTVEIRPAAGTTLNPRYFYVVKPRRLRYDNAVLPFTNLSGTEFVKTYAAAQLDLSNKEYVGSQAKIRHADAIRIEILEGLNTQATAKQKSITPYFQW